jgi:thiol:disulfide interchange protein DsbG
MKQLANPLCWGTVLLLLLTAIRPVNGGEPTAVPRALLPIVKAGFHVERQFPAVSSLTGWVVSGPGGSQEVLYTTADGKTVIAGILSNESGENLTRRYADLYETEPDLSGLWPSIHSSFQVTEGTPAKDTAHQIWVVMDPNCAFCHRLWVELRPYEKAGLVVHWIPIGILAPSSVPRAAAVLKGGIKTLQTMEGRFDEAHEQGGAPGVPLSSSLKHELAVNLELAEKAGIQGTPGIFYRNVRGELKLHQGMPAPSVLADIAGMTVSR